MKKLLAGHCAVAGVLMGVSIACSASGPPMGGQTGGEVNEPLCDEQQEVIDADTQTAVGFSLADARAAFEETTVVNPVWQASPATGEVTFVAPAQGTSLSIGVEFLDTYGWLVRSEARAGGTSNEPTAAIASLDDPCRGRLEALVRVTLRAADGSLSETFETRLRVFSLTEATFSVQLDAQQLSGAFSVMTQSPNTTAIDLQVHGRLGADATSGSSIAVTHDQVLGDTASHSITPLASW